MDEIRRSKNIILFIDELHTIVGQDRPRDDTPRTSSSRRSAVNCNARATTLNEYRSSKRTQRWSEGSGSEGGSAVD